MKTTIIAASLFACGLTMPVHAGDSTQSSAVTRVKSAEERYYLNKARALKSVGLHLNAFFGKQKNKGSQPVDFTETGRPSSRYEVRAFRIAYPWGMMAVGPREETASEPYLPDGVGFLLKKVDGRWKVLQMGTSFHDDDKKFGVPAAQWNVLGLH